jgi:hypothetical protein
MHATPAQAESAGLANAAITSEGAWGFVQLPGFLKLDASVMAYLHCSQSSQGCSVGPRGDSSVEAPKYSDVRDLNVMFKDGLSLSRARYNVLDVFIVFRNVFDHIFDMTFIP